MDDLRLHCGFVFLCVFVCVCAHSSVCLCQRENLQDWPLTASSVSAANMTLNMHVCLLKVLAGFIAPKPFIFAAGEMDVNKCIKYFPFYSPRLPLSDRCEKKQP